LRKEKKKLGSKEKYQKNHRIVYIYLNKPSDYVSFGFKKEFSTYFKTTYIYVKEKKLRNFN
jgi:hypothetical protein